MGDDYRENEPAKMVMAEHHLLFVRIAYLKKEILDLKKQIIVVKK